MIEKYGLGFPDSYKGPYQDLYIELHCYLREHKVEDGGLGAHGHLKRCMMLLWPHLYAGEVEPGVPRWREDLDLLTWAWSNYRIVSVIGHGSAGKTHTFAHMAAVRYIADAKNTIITLTSTHLKGLRSRLWADTVSAIENSVLGHKFTVRNHDLTIRPSASDNDDIDGKEDKYLIEGIAVDQGQTAVEKIQGNHSRNGRQVIIDEAEGTPKAIFDAAANLMTDPDFRMAMLANPVDHFSPFGSFCEPKAGWQSVDESDIWWETARGGVCVHLDGLRSANIKLEAVGKKPIWKFLIDNKFINMIKETYGFESLQWWMYVRGWFPPAGITGTVMDAQTLSMAVDKFEYVFPPIRIAALDPAFEGGDEISLEIGEYANVGEKDFCMNLVEEIPIKVQVQQGGKPLDYLIGDEVMRTLGHYGVKPENLIVDTTGAGRSVAAYLEDNGWEKLQRCNYGDKPTERRFKASSVDRCNDVVDRFVSELWYSAKAFIEEGHIGNIHHERVKLRKQLTARRYEMKGTKLVSVEKKKDMKNRVGYSPDRADGLCMLVELMKRRGAIPGTIGLTNARNSTQFERAKKQDSALNDLEMEDYYHGI